MLTEPRIQELISEALDAWALDMFTAIPAIVSAYDAATQTCTAQPVAKRPVITDDDTYVHETLPPIPNVPVAFFGAASLSSHFALASGDTVLLVFSMWSFARWRSTGQITEPGDHRMHGPSYPVAFPWYRPGGGPGADTDESIGKPGGQRVHFQAATTNVGAGSDFVALASAVATELGKIATALSTLTVTTGAGAGGTVIAGTPYVVGSVASTNLKAE